MTDVDNLTFVE